MRNILLVIALLFSFGISQSDAQKRSANEVEKIVIREMSKKETVKNPKYVKTREGKKANKLIVRNDTDTKGKIIVRPRPVPYPPPPPNPPCPTGVCHPISFIKDGLMLEHLLDIYPSATVVVTDEFKQKKEYKLSAKNSTIKNNEFKSFKGDLTISIQLNNRKGKENPAPVEFNLIQ